MYKEFYEKYKDDIKNCFSDLKDKDKRKKQIPNLLTASRLIAPLFIVPAAFSGNLPLAVFFTMLFEATDFVDGYFARKLDAVSEFGKDLDPIVDKIFATGLALPLVITNPLIIGNIALEALIGKINTDSKIKGNVPRTTVLGKLKTASLSIALACAYIFVAGGFISSAAVNSILVATFGIQALTAYQYKKIDNEKELAKNSTNQEIEKIELEIEPEKKKLEKVKQIARANDINELKKLKSVLLGLEQKEEEKNKEKTLKK